MNMAIVQSIHAFVKCSATLWVIIAISTDFADLFVASAFAN
jgi:hypothetical protein